MEFRILDAGLGVHGFELWLKIQGLREQRPVQCCTFGVPGFHDVGWGYSIVRLGFQVFRM